MANRYTQDNRSISISTPLGKDVLLLESFRGTEGLSSLFCYRLELLAEKPEEVKFDKILGQEVTITIDLPDNKKRYISGIVSLITQGGTVAAARKDTSFIRYRAEIVPKFWLLTRKIRSRIFQQLSVPDILKKVLLGFEVTWQLPKMEPRDYCVQYRESDFAFASRLMEEEGIYYYFKFTSSGHQMIVTAPPQAPPEMPISATLLYDDEGGENRVRFWEKTQQLRSGKVILWDHSFELPDQNLEAQEPILQSVQAGTITHQLKVAGNDQHEIYDYPGGYANRFDGIDPGGAEQSHKIQKIFEDNKRTATIRMQQEAVNSLVIRAESDCRHLLSGHKFKLDRHKDANGEYLITTLEQTGSLKGAYTGGGKVALEYANRFEAIPTALPYRPQRLTPRPVLHGTQTALVVGPKGQEIYTDKYGRVKVQFYWDREGKKDANSSCWIRVSSLIAGKGWGMVHIPRIGQEVIVAFMEGDPDQPIIVGVVHNAEQMPAYKLPDNQTRSWFKSRSTLQGTEENFNELRFEDKKGEEEIYFHAEKDFNRVVENNDTLKVGSDKAADGSQTIEIWKNRTTTIKTGDETFTLEKGKRTETLKEGDETVTLEKGSRTHSIKTDDTLTVEGKQTITITGDRTLEVKTGSYSTKVSTGSITIEAAQGVEIKCGGSSIKIAPDGITLTAGQIKLSSANITIG